MYQIPRHGRDGPVPELLADDADVESLGAELGGVGAHAAIDPDPMSALSEQPAAVERIHGRPCFGDEPRPAPSDLI
jgi:hypothetical protein